MTLCCFYFADEPVYKAVGDKVVLTPDSVPDPITIITWKLGIDIAVEWYEDEIHPYRHFTGTITHLRLRFNSRAANGFIH